MTNRNLLVKLKVAGLVLFATVLASCQGDRNDRNCSDCCKTVPIYYPYPFPVEVHHTEVKTEIKDCSGSVSVGNDVNADSEHTGSQTVNQQPKQTEQTKTKDKGSDKDQSSDKDQGGCPDCPDYDTLIVHMDLHFKSKVTQFTK